MIYAGVDPGKTGGLAVISADGEPLCTRPMPVIKATAGRDEIDLADIREWLMLWRERQLFVTVERLQPMPAKLGGAIANYQRGAAYGWAWMLTGLRIPFHLVSPQTWQRSMLADAPGDDTKQRSILIAQRLFPNVSLRHSQRAMKPHDGIADALLIAEYGRRGGKTLDRVSVNA